MPPSQDMAPLKYGVPLCLMAFVASSLVQADMPLPFTRELSYDPDDLMSGSDVTIAQTLVDRAGFLLAVDGVFGIDSQSAVQQFQNASSLPITGDVDEATASALLACCMHDGYVDDGTSAAALGYLYKIYVPVYENRSIETTATLLDADNNELMTFRVRAHGHRDDGTAEAWPDYGDGDIGLNELTSNGNTPTGLATIDLNTPEPSEYEAEYGPYPINRVVQGLEGNMGLLLSDIRSGILLHTGEWPGWDEDMDMPNSDGCLHAHPDDVSAIWKALVRIGVKVHKNPYSSSNYPYEPQGIISVELTQT